MASGWRDLAWTSLTLLPSIHCTHYALISLSLTTTEVQMRWCYMGNEEKSKCEAMKTAARSVVKNLAFTCVDGKDTAGCVKLMKENKADLVGMDGGEIMEAGKYRPKAGVARATYTHNTSNSFHSLGQTRATLMSWAPDISSRQT